MERTYSLQQLKNLAATKGLETTGTKRAIITRLAKYADTYRAVAPMTSSTQYMGGWKPGDFAIYSDFGLRSLFIVRVLDWPEEQGERFVGKFGVVHDRPMGSVRAEVIDTTLVDWDFGWEPSISEWQKEGTVHYYHYTNLFHSIEELVGKEQRIMHPWELTRMLYSLRAHPGWLMLAAYGLRDGKAGK